MPVDKDRTFTWIKFKESLCKECISTCCTMPVEVKAEDLLRLGEITEDEANDVGKKMIARLKKQGLIKSYRESTQLFMLNQKLNDDCYYLNSQTRKCTVYENRPNVCRNFPTSAGNRIGYCPMILNKTINMTLNKSQF